MKVGDLVRNKNSESGMLGLFLEWKKPNEGSQYTCPIVWWQDGRRNSIKPDFLEVISECR